MEDFATLLLPFWFTFGSRLVHVWLNFGTQKRRPILTYRTLKTIF